MDQFNYLGRILIFLGITIAALGGIIYLGGGSFSWFGRLPGDIRIEKEKFTFFFPITTMILISILLNIILRIIRFFINNS